MRPEVKNPIQEMFDCPCGQTLKQDRGAIRVHQKSPRCTAERFIREQRKAKLVAMHDFNVPAGMNLRVVKGTTSYDEKSNRYHTKGPKLGIWVEPWLRWVCADVLSSMPNQMIVDVLVPRMQDEKFATGFRGLHHALIAKHDAAGVGVVTCVAVEKTVTKGYDPNWFVENLDSIFQLAAKGGGVEMFSLLVECAYQRPGALQEAAMVGCLGENMDVAKVLAHFLGITL